MGRRYAELARCAGSRQTRRVDAPSPAILSVLRHESPEAMWEAVSGRPDPRLARLVAGTYAGWTERTALIRRRREVAKTFFPVIVNFGSRFGVRSPGDGGEGMTYFDSFTAGLYDGPAITEAALTSHCLQFDLTPLGASLLFGLPLHHLANRAVALADLLGPEFPHLVERLYEARGWERRFSLLDDFLLATTRLRPPADPRAACALGLIARSHGGIEIGALARAVDLSRKQVIGLFRDQVGLAPKAVARLYRFDRARHRLERSAGVDLAQLALDCGYFDQAHFNRDFRAFSGLSPTAFRRARLPGSGGLGAD